MGDDFPKLKAAAVQASPVFMDRDATVEKACRLIEEAGDEGAQLVVFPEVFIPAFPYWAPMSPSAPHDHARRAWNDLYKNSVEIPSESTGKLGAAARRAGATVIMGLNEPRGRPERHAVQHVALSWPGRRDHGPAPKADSHRT